MENKTLMLDPSDLYTHQNIVFNSIIEKIKQGIKSGDDLPAIQVNEISDLGNEFDGKYAVFEGTHRAYACLKLGKPVKAEFKPGFKPKSHSLQKVEDLVLDYNDELAEKHMKGKFYRGAEEWKDYKADKNPII